MEDFVAENIQVIRSWVEPIYKDEEVSDLPIIELKNRIAQALRWSGRTYTYYDGLNLMEDLVQKFLNETNPVTLREVLEFFIDIKDKSEYTLANILVNDNIHRLITHYVVHGLQNNLNDEFVQNFINDDESYNFLRFIPINDENRREIDNMFALHQNASDYEWLENQGLEIAKCLKIITPSISEAFCSILDSTIFENRTGYDNVYAFKIYKLLILPIIEMLKNYSEIPDDMNIDWESLMKMLLRFTNVIRNHCRSQYSPHRHGNLLISKSGFETVLRMFQSIRNPSQLLKMMTANYIYLFSALGLRIVDVRDKLLIIDSRNVLIFAVTVYAQDILQFIRMFAANPNQDILFQDN